MDACPRIYFISPAQLVAAVAGIIATGAAMMALFIMC